MKFWELTPTFSIFYSFTENVGVKITDHKSLFSATTLYPPKDGEAYLCRARQNNDWDRFPFLGKSRQIFFLKQLHFFLPKNCTMHNSMVGNYLQRFKWDKKAPDTTQPKWFWYMMHYFPDHLFCSNLQRYQKWFIWNTCDCTSV